MRMIGQGRTRGRRLESGWLPQAPAPEKAQLEDALIILQRERWLIRHIMGGPGSLQHRIDEQVEDIVFGIQEQLIVSSQENSESGIGGDEVRQKIKLDSFVAFPAYRRGIYRHKIIDIYRSRRASFHFVRVFPDEDIDKIYSDKGSDRMGEKRAKELLEEMIEKIGNESDRERLREVIRVLLEGESIKSVAEKFNLTPAAITHWYRDFARRHPSFPATLEDLRRIIGDEKKPSILSVQKRYSDKLDELGRKSELTPDEKQLQGALLYKLGRIEETELDRYGYGAKASTFVTAILNKNGLPNMNRKRGSEAGITDETREYFRNIDNIRYDLKAFAMEAGIEDPGHLTNNGNFRRVQALCANGERITLEAYLLRAGRRNIGTNEERRVSISAVLKELIKMAGFESEKYPPMDKNYFEQEHYKNVCRDLDAFAVANGTDALLLTTYSKISSKVGVACSNGETIFLKTYLARAGKALGIISHSSEVKFKATTILAELKRRYREHKNSIIEETF